MPSNRCTVCHRRLIDPLSIALGIGPECRGAMIKNGWKFPKPKWKVEGGRTVLVGMIGTVQPPKTEGKKTDKRKVKHGKGDDQSKS